MKCRYCGSKIPDNMLYCENCGKEVRIVPDYNPLDDMLTAQIRVSIDGGDEYEDYLDYNSSKVNTGKVSARKNTARNTSGRNTSGRNSSGRQLSPKEQKRRKQQRKKELRKKRRRIVLAILFAVLAAVGGIAFAIYYNSYTGVVKRGYKAIESRNYAEAEMLFTKGISKAEKKPDAYTGLADVYVRQNDLLKATGVFEDAVSKQKKNADIYEAFIQFYLETKQQLEIPELLDDADDSVTEALSDYIIDKPEYSLDEKQTYDDVQQLTLTAKDCTIYYTTDGTDPTFSSMIYKEPIQLDEGETAVKAIAVDKRGVPSMTAKKEYVIEFPIEDAPAVSPSTGQYESEVKIEIKVPDGYVAYYTMNGTDPTTASSKYTGPISMPEGETLFKAVLVNAKGRMSGVTTRNYVLDTSVESEDTSFDGI